MSRMSHVIRPIGRKYMQSQAVQHHLHTTSRLLALMPGKLFTLSLQKKLVSTRSVPHQPLLLQAWHPACISGVRALGECDNCQNGCVMFALYFEAATATAALGGRGQAAA